jgi:hypothetical protein
MFRPLVAIIVRKANVIREILHIICYKGLSVGALT